MFTLVEVLIRGWLVCIDFFWIASVAASLMLASLLIGGGAFSTFLVWYSDLDTCVTIGFDLLLN